MASSSSTSLTSSSPSLLSVTRSLNNPFPKSHKPLHPHPQTKIPTLSINARTLDFSGSFFEGGLGGDDGPPISPSSGITAVEDKEELQCPPGLRQYESMAVLRPDMSEDDRLTLAQKYEEEAMDVMEILKEKLPVILFDEHSKARETLCSVCLGEFEVKEELHQLPSCKHLFHIRCIRLWLHSNSTCPLCRCSVVISTENSNPGPLATGNNLPSPDTQNFNQSPRIVYTEPQEHLSIVVTGEEACTAEHHMFPNEGSSGSSDSVCFDNSENHLHAESVVISIQSSES